MQPNFSTNKKNTNYIKQPCLLGIGKVGLRFLKKAQDLGVNASLINIVINRGALSGFNEKDITQIVLKPQDLENQNLLLSKLPVSLNMMRFIVVAGLGGRSGSLVLDILTSHFLNVGVEHFSIGICPFVFEGKKKRKRAIDAIRRMENHPHFKYFDNNLIAEQHDNKVNLEKAFYHVDDIVMRFINNLLDNESVALPSWN